MKNNISKFLLRQITITFTFISITSAFTPAYSAPMLNQNLSDINKGYTPSSDTTNYIHRGGNGGDRVAADFVQVANNILTAWKVLCQTFGHYSCIELPRVKKLITPNQNHSVRVLSAKVALADDGMARDATNHLDEHGRGVIVVNRSRWESFEPKSRKSLNRIVLVLHEYLSILGVENSDQYYTSQDIAQAIAELDIDINMIASNRSLPDSCSVSISPQGKLTDKKIHLMIDHLAKKGYRVTQSKNIITRFNMTVDWVCLPLGNSSSCSIYTSILDSFLVGTYYRKHAILTYRSYEKEQVFLNAFNETYHELPVCI